MSTNLAVAGATIPTLSPQQAECVAAEAGVTKIQARAGTGKTFVLTHFAKRRPNKSLLYLAFNRNVREEAEGKFPSNVTCRTGHSLAYSTHGSKYGRDKLGNIRPASLLHLPPFSRYVNDVTQAAVVVDTLMAYLNSADPELTAGHIPEDANLRWPPNHSRTRAMIAQGRQPDPTALEAEVALNLARELWKRARERTNFDVKMPHDGYLKLYQLTSPVLNYDYVLLDEAQDSNPVILDIVLSQRNRQAEHGKRPPAKIVLVGDNCQSIYGFRNAQNAMENVDADLVLPLSKSYRFGHSVALVANAVLAAKGETVMLSGREDFVARIVTNPAEFNKTLPHTFIARTNAGIIQEAINASQQGKRLHFSGGIDKYPIGMVEDAHRLWRGDVTRIKDQTIRDYRNWDNLSKTAKALGVGTEAILVRLVGQYQDRIPDLVENIRRMTTDVPGDANVTLVSAHQSKGLEWKRVRLADDFYNRYTKRKEVEEDESPADMEERLRKESEEENLLYVALTRAIEELCLNESANEYVSRANIVFPEAPERAETVEVIVGDRRGSSRSGQPLALQDGGNRKVVPLPVEHRGGLQEASNALQALTHLMARMVAELPPERIAEVVQMTQEDAPLDEILTLLSEPTESQDTFIPVPRLPAGMGGR